MGLVVFRHRLVFFESARLDTLLGILERFSVRRSSECFYRGCKSSNLVYKLRNLVRRSVYFGIFKSACIRGTEFANFICHQSQIMQKIVLHLCSGLSAHFSEQLGRLFIAKLQLCYIFGQSAPFRFFKLAVSTKGNLLEDLQYLGKLLMI